LLDLNLNNFANFQILKKMNNKKLPEVGKRRLDKFVAIVYTLVAIMFFAQIAIICALDII